jgi:hypothetical protein
MQADEIRAIMRKRPFVPLRVRLEDGTALEVRHERGAMVTDRDLLVGVGVRSEKPLVFRDVEVLSLWRVIAIEAIPPTGTPSNYATGSESTNVNGVA